jgi:hypothetical protein
MRYAVACKVDGEPLDQFIQRKGGINECAARFSRYLKQSGPRDAGGNDNNVGSSATSLTAGDPGRTGMICATRAEGVPSNPDRKQGPTRSGLSPHFPIRIIGKRKTPVS